jgi:hypothetical protein
MFDWVAPMFRKVAIGILLAVLFSLLCWIALFSLLGG